VIQVVVVIKMRTHALNAVIQDIGLVIAQTLGAVLNEGAPDQDLVLDLLEDVEILEREKEAPEEDPVALEEIENVSALQNVENVLQSAKKDPHPQDPEALKDLQKTPRAVVIHLDLQGINLPKNHPEAMIKKSLHEEILKLLPFINV